MLRTAALSLVLLSLGAGAWAADPLPEPAAVLSVDPALLPGEDYNPPPLPRYRETGTPYDTRQSLYPYALQRSDYEDLRDMPITGPIDAFPEYAPTRALLLSYVSGQWNSVVTDLVKWVTNDPNCPTCDEQAIVVVLNDSQQVQARNQFIAAGANINKVVFITAPMNALWIRDYGPHFFWVDGTLAIADSHYYPTRPADNFIPTLLGDDAFHVPTYDMPMYFSGGNLQPGPNRTGFMSALINLDNPASEGFSDSLIREVFQSYQGIDTLHIMPQLPFSVDGTGHIDMWLYIIDENDVFISEFKPGSNATAITITNNAVPYMQALGYTVHRAPAWNVGSTHYTYSNGFRFNNRMFTLTYAAYPAENQLAFNAFQAGVGPGVGLIGIEATSIIPAAGAIHCIAKQIPRYTDPLPAAHLMSPNGGEMLKPGTTHAITWNATDTNNLPINNAALYYSLDAGATWQLIANVPNTGSYDWTVPNYFTSYAKVKVVVTAQDSDTGADESNSTFSIIPLQQSMHDATQGGTSFFGYGYQTSSWNGSVNNVRKPVSTALDGTAYAALNSSNNIRYSTPIPSSGWEATVVVEVNIAEAPADIDEIKVLWEGYAAQCAQVELYLWDYLLGQWGDGHGFYGQNRFADCWAGNRDGYGELVLHNNFNHYVSSLGQMTFLLYTERASSSSSPTPSYHDYLAVTVSRTPTPCPGDMNCDGTVDFKDINVFIDALGYPNGLGWDKPCDWFHGDVNGDGNVTFKDINPFVAALGTVCP